MKKLYLLTLLISINLFSFSQVDINELDFKYIEEGKQNLANSLAFYQNKKYTGEATTKDDYPETYTFKDGQLNGPYEKHDQKGKLLRKGVYKNGGFQGLVYESSPGSKEGTFDTIFYNKGKIRKAHKYYGNILTSIVYYKYRGKRVKTKMYHHRDVIKPFLIWKSTMIANNLNCDEVFPVFMYLTQLLADGKEVQYDLNGEKVSEIIYEADLKTGSSKVISEKKFTIEKRK